MERVLKDRENAVWSDFLTKIMSFTFSKQQWKKYKNINLT